MEHLPHESSSQRNDREIKRLEPDERAARYRRAFAHLQEKRNLFERTWNDIRRYMLPTNEHFHYKVTPGTPRDPRIVDTTGLINSQMLTSFVYTGLTNPANRWFELSLKFKRLHKQTADGRTTIVDLMHRPGVSDWLKETSDVIYTHLQSTKTRFDVANYETIASIVGFGTGCLYINHSPGEKIVFQSIPLNELYLAENFRGLIDTVYRKFSFTARQALQRWPEEGQLSAKIRELAHIKPEEELEFLHIVHPSDKSNYFGNSAYHDHYCCYLSLLDNHLIEETGSHGMPYIVGRWLKNVGEVYGVSQCTLALPDVRGIQQMHWTHIQMEEKLAYPVTLISSNSDLKMDSRPGATIPGGIDSSGRPTVANLPSGGDMNAALAMEEQVRGRIRAALMTDRLIQPEDPNRTATEARIKQMEQLRNLAPANSRLETEYAGPLIMRVYEILKAAGELPPIPEIIDGHDLVIDYLGLMSQAQKMSQAYDLSEFVQTIVPALEIDPNIKDNFDWDVAARGNANLFPLYPGFTKPMSEVKAMREAQAQMMAQEMEAAKLQQGLNQMEQVAGMEAELGKVEQLNDYR